MPAAVPVFVYRGSSSDRPAPGGWLVPARLATANSISFPGIRGLARPLFACLPAAFADDAVKDKNQDQPDAAKVQSFKAQEKTSDGALSVGGHR
jgi:hypothetical protein